MTTIIEKHLPLFLKAQSLMQFGCWEWNTRQPDLLWTEGMFVIFGIPVSADDHIPLEEINTFIHPSDMPMVKKEWEQLKAGNPVDFQCRIKLKITEELKHLHFSGEAIKNKSGELIAQGICRDVTQEKASVKILLETSDELALQLKTFKRAEEVAKSGTWRIDLNTHETFYSDNMFRLYGLTPQSLPSHLNTFASYIHPDDRTVVTGMSDLAFRNKIPLHLEYRITRADSEERYIRVISEITRGLTGEEILTGISQDITEQKQLELELKSTNEQLSIQNKHFRYTEQIAMMGTWQIDLATRETWYSDNLYRIYGLKPQQSQMGIDHFLPFVFNEDKLLIKEVAAKAFAGETVADIEFRITRTDGKLRYLQQSMKLVSSFEHGKLMIGLIHDVTEQKLLEKKLQQLNKELTIQNEAYEQAEETANIGTWRWNLTTNEMFYSDNIYRLYGLKPQSLKPGFETFQRFFHPDDLEKMRNIPSIMLSEKQPVNIEYRIYRADGEQRYLRSRNKMTVTPSGEEIFISTTQDVTDEVVIRNKLHENIRFIRILNNHLIDQVMVTDTANIIVEFNKAAENIQGVTREDVLGRNFFEVFPLSKVPEIIDNLNKALNGEIVHDKSITSPLNKGMIDRYHIPLRDEDGKVIGVLTVVHDITEEYRLRNELQQRLAFTETLMDASISRIIAFDRELNYITWNKRAEEFYGLKKEKVLGRNVLEFNPAFKKDPLYDELEKAFDGELVYIAPNETGKDGYHETYFIPLKNDQQNVTGVLWMINDLTERREAEKAVAESNNLLQQTAEASPDAITIYDIQNKEPLYLNTQLADWIGVSTDTLVQMGVEGRIQLVHPEDRKALIELNNSFFDAADSEIKTLEYRLHTKQRKYIWIRNRGKVFKRDGKGKVTHILSVLQDITQQKQAELELRESKMFVENVMDAMPDFIMVFNLITNKIDFVSQSAYKGDEERYRQSLEIDYQRILERAHPDDRKGLNDYINSFRIASDDKVHSFDYRVVKGDEVIWYRSRGKVFKRDKDRKATHYICIVQNITEQKHAEKVLHE